MTMTIAELWRYPVKSLAGERLESADLTSNGIAGDRLVQVREADGRIVTSRTRHQLLGLRGTLDPAGRPLIDGQRWDSPEALALVRKAAGPTVRLTYDPDPHRFDVLPLLVATDGAIARLGVDRRRLRPNILIAGVPGLAERDWPGRALQIGRAAIGIRQLRQRCVMTTFDPDTLVQDVAVLRRIYEQFDGTMALDCDVIAPGPLAPGDHAALVPYDSLPRRVRGRGGPARGD